MLHTGRRALLLGCGALAWTTLTAVASAAPVVTRLSDQAARDVTADGRYVLLADGSVVDRATRGTFAAPPGPVSDLASGGTRLLYQRGATWFVRDPAAGAISVPVNYGPDGAAVGITSAQLVRNGRAVTFSTDESPHRILTIVVGARSSTTVLDDADLVRASDDGRVVAFTRELTPERRPSGPAGAGARQSVSGSLAGYIVDGSAPRVVGITRWIERLAAPSGAVPCAENPAQYQRTSTAITLAQDGLAGGRYLVPATTTTDDPSWPAGEPQRTRTWQDPYSAATTQITDTHGSFPLYNEWGLSTGTAAPGVTPALLPPAGSADPAGLATTLLAFNGGGGAVLTATPRAGGGAATFVTEGDAVASSSASGWQALPRPTDPVLTGNERVQTTWATCADPPAKGEAR